MISTVVPKDWVDGKLGKLISNIREQIFSRILINTDYMMRRHILLKNDDIAEYDQKPHSDYPIRSFNT